MSGLSNPEVSIGIAFFGAVRDLNRRVNSALTSIKSSLVEQGIFGVSEADLTVLHLILEFEGTTSTPIKIAEQGMMDKGAFTRLLPALERSELVVLERDGKTITNVTLTDKARTIAQRVQQEMNRLAQDLIKSQELKRLASQFTAD